MTDSIRTFEVTFLCHAAFGSGNPVRIPVGHEFKATMPMTFEQMLEYIDLINKNFRTLHLHITNATVPGEQTFICADISEIWDEYPAIQAHQSIKSYRENMALHPEIYTQESLDKMIAREGWEQYVEPVVS